MTPSPDPAARDRPLRLRTNRPFELVGGFFLLLGAALAAGCLWLGLRPPAETPLWVRVALVIASALPAGFALLGLLLTLSGERIVLDPAAGEVRIARGRWWVWQRVRHAFSDFDAVVLETRSFVGAGSAESTHGRPRYGVRLIGADRELELGDRNHNAARRLGERVAALVRVPLRDTTTAEVSERGPDELDVSLRERVRRLGKAPEWPRLAPSNRIRVGRDCAGTLLRLPGPDPKMVRAGLYGLAFLLAIYGGAWWVLGRFAVSALASAGVEGELVRVLAWSLPGIPALWILAFGGLLLVGREEVLVSARRLEARWRLWPVGVVWRSRADVAAIEELVADRDDVVVRTDGGRIRVGIALHKAERLWLQAALRCLLVRGPGGIPLAQVCPAGEPRSVEP